MQLKNKRFKKTVISLGLATAMAVMPAVANLGGVGASIIADAATNEISSYDNLVDACKKGGTYTLAKSIKVTSPVSVTANITIKSPDEKYVIYCADEITTLFEVTGKGRLTLGASTDDETRVLLRGGTADNGLVKNAVITAKDGGEIILNRARIYRTNGVGVRLYNATCTLNGHTKGENPNNITDLKPSSAKAGAVALFDGSTFYMKGGVIGGNGTSIGGVTIRPGSTFIMTGGKISANSGGAGDITLGKDDWWKTPIKNGNGYGGGVFNQGTFEMKGGEISGNISYKGGGVYNAKKMIFTGGKIANNSITGSSDGKKGDGIYNAGTLEVGGSCLVSSGETTSNNVTLDSSGKINVISPFKDTAGNDDKNTTRMVVELPENKLGTVVADCTGGMDASNIEKNIDIKNKGDLVLRGAGTKLILSKKCKITFDLNGDSQVEDAETKEIYYDEGFKLPSKEEIMSKYSKKGHVLADALKGPSGDLQYDITCAAKGDMLIEAVWNPKKYTVSYDLNGGTGTQPAPVSSDFINGITITDVIPERTGFDFGGWSVTQNPSVTSGAGIYQPNAKVNYEIEDDTKLYAIWNPKVITITYNTDGGTSIPATIGDYINRPRVTDVIPVRPGFIFIGWINEAKNNNSESANNTIDENTVLRAKWEEIKYTITYDTAGGSKIEDTVGTYTTKPVVTSTIPTKDGYNFICWKDEAGNIYLPGSIIDKDLKLTAEWKATPVTITYDTAGGTPMEPTVGDKKSNPTVKAPAQREGYTFEGWKDPNVENIVTPGTAYNHDVTLKAIWVKTDNIEWKMNVTNNSQSIKIYDNETAAISYSKKLKKALSLTIKATRTTLKEGTNEKETANANIDYQIVKKGKQYVSSQNAWKSAKNGKITVNNAMNSSIYIRLTAGGKAKIYKTEGFSVDTLSPSITGVKNNKFYTKAVTVKVKDSGSGIRYVKLNGKKVKTTFKVSKNGSYKVVAVDKFGNTKTVKFAIRK